MYQNNEVDYLEDPDPASLTLMMGDEATAKEVYSGVGDFPTWYIFFDVTKAPFDNKMVRQAWSHAIDRDTLKSQVLGPSGTPGLLLAGARVSRPRSVRRCRTSRSSTRRWPRISSPRPASRTARTSRSRQMWLRAPSPLDKTVAGALSAMLKENLNIEVEL